MVVLLLKALRTVIMPLRMLLIKLIELVVGLLIVLLVLLKLIHVIIPAVVTLAIVVALVVLSHLRLLCSLIVTVLLLSSIPVFELLLLVLLLLIISSAILWIVLILVLHPLILILVHLIHILIAFDVLILTVRPSVLKPRPMTLHIFRWVFWEIVKLQLSIAPRNELLSFHYQTCIHFLIRLKTIMIFSTSSKHLVFPLVLLVRILIIAQMLFWIKLSIIFDTFVRVFGLPNLLRRGMGLILSTWLLRLVLLCFISVLVLLRLVVIFFEVFLLPFEVSLVIVLLSLFTVLINRLNKRCNQVLLSQNWIFFIFIFIQSFILLGLSGFLRFKRRENHLVVLIDNLEEVLELLFLLKLFHQIKLLLLPHFTAFLFRGIRNRARIDLFTFSLFLGRNIFILIILLQRRNFVNTRLLILWRNHSVLVDGPRDVERIHFALLIADFESYILLQEIIHVHFFVECVVAYRKLIKQSSLLVFASFEFELFQILYILGQTLMEILFAHERRNPSNDHSEQLPCFYLNFD